MTEAGGIGNGARLWTGYFVLVCIMGLFTSLVMRLLDNTLAIYANDVWNSKSDGGLLTTTFTFGSIVSSALCGSIIDRTGRQKAMIAGAAIFVVVTVVLMFTTVRWIVLTVRALQGLGKAVCMVASASMAADIIPRERMGEGMGYYGLGSTLASAFGPALGIAMISTGSYDLMFGSCAGLYFVVIIMAIFVNYEKKGSPASASTAATQTAAAKQDPTHEYRGVWKLFEKSAIPSAAVTFFGSAGTVCILVFLTLYATDGLGIENPGLFFTFSAVTMLITRLVIGRMVDRFGVVIALLPALLLAVGIYLLLAFAAPHSYMVFLLCGAIYGVSMSMFYPALQAAAVVDAPEERKGVANSTLFFGQDLGILVASAALGWVLESYGYVLMFMGGIVLFVISGVLSLLLMSNRARARRRRKYGVPDPGARA